MKRLSPTILGLALGASLSACDRGPGWLPVLDSGGTSGFGDIDSNDTSEPCGPADSLGVEVIGDTSKDFFGFRLRYSAAVEGLMPCTPDVLDVEVSYFHRDLGGESETPGVVFSLEYDTSLGKIDCDPDNNCKNYIPICAIPARIADVNLHDAFLDSDGALIVKASADAAYHADTNEGQALNASASVESPWRQLEAPQDMLVPTEYSFNAEFFTAEFADRFFGALSDTGFSAVVSNRADVNSDSYVFVRGPFGEAFSLRSIEGAELNASVWNGGTQLVLTQVDSWEDELGPAAIFMDITGEVQQSVHLREATGEAELSLQNGAFIHSDAEPVPGDSDWVRLMALDAATTITSVDVNFATGEMMAVQDWFNPEQLMGVDEVYCSGIASSPVGIDGSQFVVSTWDNHHGGELNKETSFVLAQAQTDEGVDLPRFMFVNKDHFDYDFLVEGYVDDFPDLSIVELSSVSSGYSPLDFVQAAEFGVITQGVNLDGVDYDVHRLVVASLIRDEGEANRPNTTVFQYDVYVPDISEGKVEAEPFATLSSYHALPADTSSHFDLIPPQWDGDLTVGAFTANPNGEVFWLSSEDEAIQSYQVAAQELGEWARVDGQQYAAPLWNTVQYEPRHLFGPALIDMEMSVNPEVWKDVLEIQ